MNYAFSELEAAGYTIGSAYTAVKDPVRTYGFFIAICYGQVLI